VAEKQKSAKRTAQGRSQLPAQIFLNVV
jgi:hypothetical protein